MPSPPERSPGKVSAVVPVFRDPDRTLNAVQHLLTQQLPDDASLEILVVDDGSDSPTVDRLRQILPPCVHLLALRENQGRSIARQAGIDAATGDIILFMDCDCEPTDSRFIANHLSRLTADTVASIGPIVGLEDDFWGRYQQKASDRRRAMFNDGVPYCGSTQNMMVRTSALRAAGGFDARYRHYGFEDRDLLVRLSTLGRIVWCEDSVSRHLDRLSMVLVSEKMRAAGRESSRLFASQHPAAYRALGYAAVDVHEKRCWRLPARVLAHLLQAGAKLFDLVERRRLLPWPVSFLAVRGISAASYLVGTMNARSPDDVDKGKHEGAPEVILVPDRPKLRRDG